MKEERKLMRTDTGEEHLLVSKEANDKREWTNHKEKDLERGEKI